METSQVFLALAWLSFDSEYYEKKKAYLTYIPYHLFQVVDLFVEGYKLFAKAHGKAAGKRDFFFFAI